ncbi:MAG TPA: hypothetical protein VN039_08970 [Nitrospira sp.]|nr:hypothetical protein [Nitrospira sp.]
MLGWGVMVLRPEVASTGKPECLLARWTTGVSGLGWLEDLVKEGKAIDLGGDGYPNRYPITLDLVLPILHRGLPSNDSPVVIGEDYLVPPGCNGKIEVNTAELVDCSNSESLVVEAWDQS